MKPTKEQLAVINSRLPGTTVKADQVECLSFMVFDNLVTDRYTIMSPEMMRKLEQDFNSGRAVFNKMHESRERLPFGRSVSGRVVDKEAEGLMELQATLYAVIKRPDGTNFVDAKDVVDRYNTGAAYACSAGVQVGFYKCTICGNDIRDYSKCEHLPGRVYTVDEQPKQCFAIMTGRKIKDGVAEDCSVYEVSAVSAGGVANARTLTETFGAYSEGADPAEFKKEALDKGVETRIEFSAAKPESKGKGSKSMEKHEVQELLQEHYKPLKEANDKLQGEYDQLKEEAAGLKTKITEQEEAYATLQSELTTAKEALTKAESDLAAASEAQNSYKDEYVSLVVADGVKAGHTVTVEEFADKSVEDLKALHDGYVAEIAKLPSGRQSTSETGEGGQEYSGIPDVAFTA